MNRVFQPFYVKFRAKKAMQGKFGLTLGATSLPVVIITLLALCVLFVPAVRESLELITGGSFESSDAQAEYIVNVYSNLIYTISLVLALFNFLTVGGDRICLDILTGRKTSLKKLLAYYDKWYIALIWPLVTFLLSLCGDFMLEYMYDTNVNEYIIEIILFHYELATLFVTFKTAFLPIALAENGCTSFVSAFKTSWKMTSFKTIVSIFLLYISFIGWFFLIALTFIPIIYVLPYFRMSIIALYQSVKENMEQNLAEQAE